MAFRIMAAIDVGAYELEMKIFEISKKKGIVTLNTVRHVVDLGKDTYASGMIAFTHIHELCECLLDFRETMKEYGVEDYVAYATSSLREAVNRDIVIDRITVKTGLTVKVLSNSEQRFLCYRAMAVKSEFANMIQEGTAIVDVGAGSIQISLFDKEALVTTQNIKLGTMRIRELLYSLSDTRKQFENLIEELVNNELETFQKLFQKDKSIKNIVAIGEFIGYFTKKTNKQIETMTREQFLERFASIREKNISQLSEKIGITEEEAVLMIPCVMVYKRLMDKTETENIWFPQFDLCDGIAADYGLANGILQAYHDFEADIFSAARNIARRYKGNMNHTKNLEQSALAIFDAMKRYHGLGKRDRILIQLAAILHDCGKYVSMSQSGQASYYIILASEIIGITRAEREIVANVVRYNTEDFDFDDMELQNMDRDAYMRIVKLVAILRISNAMDRSHKQKFMDVKAVIKKQELIITTCTKEDITLEKGLFKKKAEFFEEVYGIIPVLKKSER